MDNGEYGVTDFLRGLGSALQMSGGMYSPEVYKRQSQEALRASEDEARRKAAALEQASIMRREQATRDAEEKRQWNTFYSQALQNGSTPERAKYFADASTGKVSAGEATPTAQVQPENGKAELPTQELGQATTLSAPLVGQTQPKTPVPSDNYLSDNPILDANGQVDTSTIEPTKNVPLLSKTVHLPEGYVPAGKVAPVQSTAASQGSPHTVEDITKAIWGTEGSRPNQVSVQGASGVAQITRPTFDTYKREGESFNIESDRQAVAKRKIANDYARYDGDPAKVAAAYFGGASAVQPDGTIDMLRKDATGTTMPKYINSVLGKLGITTAQPQPEQVQKDVTYELPKDYPSDLPPRKTYGEFTKPEAKRQDEIERKEKEQELAQTRRAAILGDESAYDQKTGMLKPKALHLALKADPKGAETLLNHQESLRAKYEAKTDKQASRKVSEENLGSLAEDVSVHKQNFPGPRDLYLMGTNEADFNARVRSLNPEYRKGDFDNIKRAENAFSIGKQGDGVRSIGTARQHLELMKQVFDAQKNGDIPLANSLFNQVKTAFGMPATTNVDAGALIVANEVIKGITAGVPDAEQKAKALNILNSSKSPAAFYGAIDTVNGLLDGQQRNLYGQYKRSTHKPKSYSFDDFKNDMYAFEDTSKASGNPPPAASASPSTASTGWSAVLRK